MKSKKAEANKCPRYEEYHVEKLRRRYLFHQLWRMSSAWTVWGNECLISDEEIEPHHKKRRDIVVDMVRDGLLEPLDMIPTRGPKHFQIAEGCMTDIKTIAIDDKWKLELGSTPVIRSWSDCPASSELWAACGALAEGTGYLNLESDGIFTRLSVRMHPAEEFENADTIEEDTKPGFLKPPENFPVT